VILVLGIAAVGLVTSLVLGWLGKKGALAGGAVFLYVLSIPACWFAVYRLQLFTDPLLFDLFRFTSIQEKARTLLSWGIPALPPLLFLWCADRRVALRTSLVLLIILGAMVLLGGVLLFRERRDFLKHAHAVEGTVTHLSDVNGTGIQYPSVWVKDDRVGFSLYRHGGHPPSLSIGSTHRILCSPRCGGDALLDTWKDRWGGVVGLAICGAAFLGAGLGGAIVLRNVPP
jgi:hypothetical protein